MSDTGQGGSVQIELTRPVDKTDVSHTSRPRASRWMSVAVTTIVLVTAPTMLVGFWGSLLGHETIGGMIGFALGAWALAKLAPRRLFVYNPEWRGYVTQNVLDGKMVPYGPGAHPSHWWEQRNAEGNYSLEVKSAPLSVVIATTTVSVTVSGQFEFGIDLSNIERAIGVSQATVSTGINAFVEAELIRYCAGLEADDIRENIANLTTHMNGIFKDKGNPVQKNYGFRTTSIVINKIALASEVQTTQNAIAEADKLFSVIAKLVGKSERGLRTALSTGEISQSEYQRLLTRAMAVSDNKTTIDVKVIEGLDDGKQEGGNPRRGRGRRTNRDAAKTGIVMNAVNQKGGSK